MAGEKRERDDSKADLPDAKKQKLDSSGSGFWLSPIREPEQSSSTYNFEGIQDSFEADPPKTPDTQPLAENIDGAYENNKNKLSEEEKERVIAIFREQIAQLNANQFHSPNENTSTSTTLNNMFCFELIGHDFYQLPLNIQDELFDALCLAIQKNTQINALQIYADGGLTSDQTQKLISAARNPKIKKIVLDHMIFNEARDPAKFFESVVIENPHLEDLGFGTYDFHISNLNYSFTEYFQNPENQVNFFKQAALKKLKIKIYDILEFRSFIYCLLEKNNSIQDLEVDCDCMETEHAPEYFLNTLNSILFNIYIELNSRLKTSFNFVRVELSGGARGLSHNCNIEHFYGKKDPRKTFKYLIKRNQELNVFPLHKNLILHFYAELDEDLANRPEEGLSEEHQALLKYVTTKDSPVDVSVSKFSNEVLELLDRFLETQLQFALEKLNLVYQKSFENQTEMLSVRNEAKSNFDAVDQKSQIIKREIFKRQPPQVASIIGKDMYLSSGNSAEVVLEAEQSSDQNFLGIKN